MLRFICFGSLYNSTPGGITLQHTLRSIILNVELKRRLSVFSNLYQAGCLDFLWATRDTTRGDFCNTLGMAVAKRLEVTAVKVSQHTQPPF
jgi:hypothetical protein